MPSSVIAKIKSAPKAARLLIFLGVALGLLLIGAVLPYGPPTAVLQADGHSLSLEIADTAQARSRGLSGRKTMAVNQGMLFSYTQPTKQCFWMRGMRFSLDMVWLNAAQRVVYLKRQVSPKTYPETFCTPVPAQYVIELNGGEVQTLGIHAGEQLHF